jgi:hypothetical protein
VTKVEDLTGFPECLDGRVKTLHPAVHAGLLADVRQPAHREQLRERGIAPFELLVSNLYPFEETVASGAPPRSAWSRSISAARPWCAPRPRTTPTSPSSPTRRCTRRWPRPSRAAGSRWRGGAASRPGPSRTRPATTRPSPPGSPRSTRRTTPPPRPAGRTWSPRSGPGGRCCATGRTRTRRGAVRRDGPAAGHRRRPAAARQGDVLQQLRGHGGGLAGRVRVHRALRRDHQARQPVRDRDRRRPGRGAPQGARLRSGVGLRRGHRRQRRGDEALAAQIADVFTEVVAAPGFEPAAATCSRRRRTCGCWPARRPTGRRRGPSGASWTAACSSSPRTS